MTKQTLEIALLLYDDSTGEYIEVHEDPDGLDMVELRTHDENGKVTSVLNPLTTDQARAIALALVKACDHIDARVHIEKENKN